MVSANELLNKKPLEPLRAKGQHTAHPKKESHSLHSRKDHSHDGDKRIEDIRRVTALTVMQRITRNINLFARNVAVAKKSGPRKEEGIESSTAVAADSEHIPNPNILVAFPLKPETNQKTSEKREGSSAEEKMSPGAHDRALSAKFKEELLVLSSSARYVQENFIAADGSTPGRPTVQEAKARGMTHEQIKQLVADTVLVIINWLSILDRAVLQFNRLFRAKADLPRRSPTDEDTVSCMRWSGFNPKNVNTQAVKEQAFAA